MSDVQDHPEYRGLLAAVKAAPDDDLPRLVLADWLEEHDSPDWAEFIRAQCMLDQFPHAARIRADTYTDAEGVLPDWQQPLTAARRAREYTDAEGVLPDWQQPLTAARRARELCPAAAAELLTGELNEGQTAAASWNGKCSIYHLQVSRPRYELRRGFIESVTCPIARWMGEGHHLPLGPLLVARQPVREVAFTSTECGREGPAWLATEGEDFSLVELAASSWVPWSIAARFGREDQRRYGPDGLARLLWRFPNREAAMTVLSRAAIAWAEAEAGV